jgi:predicted ABC-type ATPase
VGMFYVSLASLDLALPRIGGRVAAGRHGVPEEKVRKRWPLSHRMLRRFVPKLDVLYVYDNSSDPVLVASKTSAGIQLIRPGRLPSVDEALQEFLH